MKSIFQQSFETVVIGGGFAGSAAAWVAAREGKTLLLSSSLDALAFSAWGPRVVSRQSLEKTKAGRSFYERVLHPSFLGEISLPEGQLALFDTVALRRQWQAELEGLEGLALYQDTAESIERSTDLWQIKTRWGSTFLSKRVILALGTFLGARYRVGGVSKLGGRPGETGAEHLQESLEALGVTFAPARRAAAPTLMAESVDTERLVPLSPPDGPVRAYESSWADGERVFLAPMTRAALELYPLGAKTTTRAIDESNLREARGLSQAQVVTPGFEVEYLKVSSAPKDLGFAGAIDGTNDYVSAISSGFVAGAGQERVSRET